MPEKKKNLPWIEIFKKGFRPKHEQIGVKKAGPPKIKFAQDIKNEPRKPKKGK